eukprot:UN04172
MVYYILNLPLRKQSNYDKIEYKLYLADAEKVEVLITCEDRTRIKINGLNYFNQSILKFSRKKTVDLIIEEKTKIKEQWVGKKEMEMKTRIKIINSAPKPLHLKQFLCEGSLFLRIYKGFFTNYIGMT